LLASTDPPRDPINVFSTLSRDSKMISRSRASAVAASPLQAAMSVAV